MGWRLGRKVEFQTRNMVSVDRQKNSIKRMVSFSYEQLSQEKGAIITPTFTSMTRVSTSDAQYECGRRPNVAVGCVSFLLFVEDTKPSSPDALLNHNRRCPLTDRIVLASGHIADVETVRRYGYLAATKTLGSMSDVGEGRILKLLRH